MEIREHLVMPKKPKPGVVRRKALEYAYRVLSERDGISIKAAKRKYKNARMELIFTRAQERLANDFIEAMPGKFLRIEKGDPDKPFGRVYKSWEVEKQRRIHIYWNTVHLLRESLGMTHKQAMAYIRKTRTRVKKESDKQYGKTSRQRLRSGTMYSLWLDLGVYKEKSPKFRRRR